MTTTSFLRNSLTALAIVATLASAPGAQAKPFFPHPHHGWGPGIGIGIGLGLLGAAAASAAYASGPVCHLERRFDDYGNYIGRVRVCE